MRVLRLVFGYLVVWLFWSSGSLRNIEFCSCYLHARTFDNNLEAVLFAFDELFLLGYVVVWICLYYLTTC